MHVYFYNLIPQCKGLDASTVAIAKRLQKSGGIV